MRLIKETKKKKIEKQHTTVIFSAHGELEQFKRGKDPIRKKEMVAATDKAKMRGVTIVGKNGIDTKIMEEAVLLFTLIRRSKK